MQKDKGETKRTVWGQLKCWFKGKCWRKLRKAKNKPVEIPKYKTYGKKNIAVRAMQPREIEESAPLNEEIWRNPPTDLEIYAIEDKFRTKPAITMKIEEMHQFKMYYEKGYREDMYLDLYRIAAR